MGKFSDPEVQKFGNSEIWKSKIWKFGKSEVRKNGNSANRKVRKKGYPKE